MCEGGLRVRLVRQRRLESESQVCAEVIYLVSVYAEMEVAHSIKVRSTIVMEWGNSLKIRAFPVLFYPRVHIERLILGW